MYVLLLIGCSGTGSGVGSKDTRGTDTSPADTAVGDSDTSETTETADTGETADSEESRLDTSPRDECELVIDTDLEPPPTLDCDPALPWVHVAAGLNATCGIKSDGCLQCWGEGVGAENFAVPGVAYQKVAMSSMTWDAAPPHVCGLTRDGTVLCWGGSNWASENDTPVGAFKDIAAGSSEGWALGAAGGIVEWGMSGNCLDGDYLEVVGSDFWYGAVRADGTLEVSGGITFPYVADGTWTNIAHGTGWVCGLRTDLGDAIRCVGAGDASETSFPFGGVNPEGAFVDVCAAGGLKEVCALDANGTPTCWSGDETNALMDPPPGPFTELTCGGGHACGLTPEGRIECWGEDHAGETIPPS